MIILQVNIEAQLIVIVMQNINKNSIKFKYFSIMQKAMIITFYFNILMNL